MVEAAIKSSVESSHVFHRVCWATTDLLNVVCLGTFQVNRYFERQVSVWDSLEDEDGG
jgi:hypothetical protein